MTVLDVVAVLPQPSIAVNVLVCVALQLVVDMDPSVCVTVGIPQASVAVAEPSAALISDAVALQPSDVVVPLAVIAGGVLSLIHVTVLEVVAVLPQASLAVNVLVCDTPHAFVEVVVGASAGVTVTAPQASVPVADPKAALISEAEGLQPRVVVVPTAVIDGGVLSAVHTTVLDVVAVLPQASLAVNVLVCDAEQLPVITVPSAEVIVTAPHASVAVALANAVLISATAGLQPNVTLA